MPFSSQNSEFNSPAGGQHSIKGFTLIESLVFLFIFALISVTFFQTYATGTRLIIESKNRLGATALANQKMEIVRSLGYDTIGTKHWNGSGWAYGVPPGDILEDETVSVNTVNYTVHTDVQYIDDSFDGTDGAGDLAANDYKSVKITVMWGNKGTDQSAFLISNIAPNGMEVAAGGGTLSINVLDSAGIGVSGATVRVVNSSTGTDFTTQTDTTGNIMRPGTPAGIQNFALTVSKTGYYGVVTYPPTPTYEPTDVHASVVAGVLNQTSIIMDHEADITVHSKDYFETDIPNIGFNMKGGKVLGTDWTNPLVPVPVYGYDQNLNTNASGSQDIPNQSYGLYTLSESSARYELYKLNPAAAAKDTFDARAGVATVADMILLDTEVGSVKVAVTNKSDSTPVPSGSAHLTNSLIGYDETKPIDQYGMAYFSIDSTTGLTAGTYTLEVSSTGFQSDTSTADVSSALVTKNIELIPN